MIRYWLLGVISVLSVKCDTCDNLGTYLSTLYQVYKQQFLGAETLVMKLPQAFYSADQFNCLAVQSSLIPQILVISPV